MKVTMFRELADAIVKTGTWHGMVPVGRVQIRTELGWSVFVRAEGCTGFFRVGGEGAEYTAAQVTEMVAEVERLDVQDRIVVMDREPPTWRDPLAIQGATGGGPGDR